MSGFKSGFFWGAVFGTVAGLMNAPAKGSETRKNVSNFISQTKEDIFILNQQKNHLLTVINQIKEKNLPDIQEQIANFATNFREFSEIAQPRVNRIKRRLEVINTHLSEINE